LILSSSLEDYDKPKSDWMKLVAERFDLQTGEVRGELPAGYASPSVQVVTEPQTDHQPVGKSRGPDLARILEEAHELAEGGGGIIPHEVADFPVDNRARRAFSFSRLTGKLRAGSFARFSASDDDEELSPPVDGRGLGSLVHDVLARIDWRSDEQDIGGWCELLAGRHVVVNTHEVAEQACEMIERFAASPRARQLASARAVHREVEFLLAWPPGETSGDGRYIRGYIDCLYQDEGGRWHLVDYKTNNVAAGGIAKLAQQYELQLFVYALAAEQAIGTPPAELALAFLCPGAEHQLSWNEEARNAAIDRLNQEIASATARSLQRPVEVVD
jgi:hypothetical protein